MRRGAEEATFIRRHQTSRPALHDSTHIVSFHASHNYRDLHLAHLGILKQESSLMNCISSLVHPNTTGNSISDIQIV